MSTIYDEVTSPDEHAGVLTVEQRDATTAPIPSGPVYVDKADLFRVNLPEEDVDVDGIGTVRVRALSRAEVMRVTGTELPKAKLDTYVLSRGMVEPQLTEDEVKAWQKAGAAGRLETVSRAIMRLSGLTEVAAKSVVPEDDE